MLYSLLLEVLKQNLEALIKDINTIRLTDDYKLENLDFLTTYNLIESIDILSDSVNDLKDYIL
jgi:hypothetical protein